MPDTKQLMDNFRILNRLIKEGTVISGYALGFGGAAEALAKMSFGNAVGADVTIKESDLFNFGNGSIIVESKEILELPGFELIGSTTTDGFLKVNGEAIAIDEAFEANRKKFTAVYPDRSGVKGSACNAVSAGAAPPMEVRPRSTLWFISPFSPAQTATTTWPNPSPPKVLRSRLPSSATFCLRTSRNPRPIWPPISTPATYSPSPEASPRATNPTEAASSSPA